MITRLRHGEASHGKESKLWRCWGGMKARVCSPRPREIRYQGIKVCEEWSKSYEVFRDWALSNGYQSGLTIDRIDSDGDYSPQNCRWITRKDQMHNRRDNFWIEAFGERKLPSDWIKDARCNLRYSSSLVKRVRNGWNKEQAVATPSRKK